MGTRSAESSTVAARGARRDADLESRILREFSARARRNGPRAVVMADLARDLSISTKTLYRLYPTKADLVHRLMRSWAKRFETDLDSETEGADDETLFVDQLLNTSEVWRASRRRFSNRFWEELASDYPDSYALLADARGRFRARILERLGSRMAPGVNPDLAIELFDALLARAIDSDVQRRLGVDSRTAIRNAVQIWTTGALDEPLPRRTRAT